uniref:RINT1-like protein MAG2 n=1 Tax=Rhizophora mucronata TaxID=61149 RepID=A0A2P2JQT1_RHIMU
MDSIQTLPPLSALSSSAVAFLDDKLRSQEDLSTAPSLVSDLQSQCCELDRALVDLNVRLGSSLLAYASFSDRVHGLFSESTSNLTKLRSLTGASATSLSYGGGDKEGRKEQILGEELPVLAKEVAMVETVRAYAGKGFFFLLFFHLHFIVFRYAKVIEIQRKCDFDLVRSAGIFNY